jgi:uncharacterized protein
MTAPETPGPIAAEDRILDLDILRGMALFGILAANMRGFSAPLDIYFDIVRWFHSRPDVIAQLFIDIFIQRKFVTLFSFMFGMGFAVQLTRAEAKGVPFLSFYPRRLAVLALFGILHGMLIWSGDILLTYALTGAVLLLFRKTPTKALLYPAAGIASGFFVFITGQALWRLWSHWTPPKPEEEITVQKIAAIVQIYADGSFAAMMRQNWVEWVRELRSQAFVVYALILFLLGYWVVRQGILENLKDWVPKFKKVAALCLPLGVALNAAQAILPHFYHSPRPIGIAWTQNMLDFYSGPILSAGYAAGLAVLLQNPSWRTRLTIFAAVGRMALTNYLFESIFCVTFFRLTHLYGVWGPLWDLLPTVVLFYFQLQASNWWLQRYRMGPMEWIWRGLTYGRFPALPRHVPQVV